MNKEYEYHVCVLKEGSVFDVCLGTFKSFEEAMENRGELLEKEPTHYHWFIEITEA